MRAVVKDGQKIEIREVADPRPAPDEMLVRVEVVSLNRGELHLIEVSPDGTIPGWDVAGIVVQPSSYGKGLPEGTRIAGIVRNGAWAELVAVPSGSAAALPDSLSYEEASTLPIAALTAWQALVLGGSLLGARTLVTGGSGGVGRFTVQLARRAGAHVTAVASAQHHQKIRELGAHATVSSIDEAEGVFDWILESVGGASLATAIDLVAKDGLIVSIGNSSGEETRFNARSLYRKTGARLHGLMIFDEVSSGRIGPRELRHLADLVASGELRTDIGLRTSWRRLDEALERLRTRSVDGKAVLTID